MKSFKSLSLLALLTIPFAAQAQVAFTGQNSPNGNTPLSMPAWSVIATGGDVMATIESFDFNGSPSFNNELYAVNSGNTLTDIGNNHSFGTTVDLGTFAKGQEVSVSMLSQQGYTYYTGSNASLNADGYNHADLYSTGAGTVVDFEDLSGLGSIGNSDWNYGDAKLVLSNTQAVPEPFPCAVLALGVLGLIVRRKRS